MIVDKHPIGIILKSNAVKGIRFTIHRDHWKGTAHHARLPEKVFGAVDKWGGSSKADNKIQVDWESDGSNSVEHLEVLLQERLQFTLLPYANGKSAPKAKGAAARREYATATTTGPYAKPDEQQPEARQIEVRLVPITLLPMLGPPSFYPARPFASNALTPLQTDLARMRTRAGRIGGCRGWAGASHCGIEWDEWLLVTALLSADDAVLEFVARCPAYPVVGFLS